MVIPRATTKKKKISLKKLRCYIKKYLINVKQNKEKQKKARNIQKTKSKMTDINAIISIISLNVREIIQPKERLPDSF